MPNYNGERFIAASLESVCAQTYENLEIIVVDDGSIDSSVSIVQKIILEDDRIRLIQQRNRGVAAARNTGIENATGHYVAPIDSDDVWYRDKISKQVDTMLASAPRVGLVYAWSATIDADGNFTGGVNASHLEDDVFVDLLFGNFIGNGSAPMFKRECLDEIGGYDEEFARLDATGCEDRDLYLRMAERFRFAVVKKVLIGYRHHECNMSSDAGRMNRSHRLVINRLRERHNMPDHYLRRSSAFNALYLERIEARKKHFVASAGNMARALLHDPGLIAEPGFYRLVRIRALQLIRHWFPSIRRRRSGSRADDGPQLCLQTIEQRASGDRSSWVEIRKRRSSSAVRQWIAENSPTSLKQAIS